MAFSQRLHQLRREHGLSQEELGSVIGVSRQAVQKWESGASTPDIENLSALADYFQISLDYLVRGVEAAPEPPPAQTVVHHYYGYCYEYRSSRTLFGLPLVHISLGYGLRRARGIIAIGNIATGLLAIGGLSVGGISIGGLSLGLLALGGGAVGALAAGGMAVALLCAVGGGAVSAGLSLGGMAVGRYAVGGAAFGSVLAIGDAASSPRLALTLEQIRDMALRGEPLMDLLLARCPDAPRWLLSLLASAVHLS